MRTLNAIIADLLEGVVKPDQKPKTKMRETMTIERYTVKDSCRDLEPAPSLYTTLEFDDAEICRREDIETGSGYCWIHDELIRVGRDPIYASSYAILRAANHIRDLRAEIERLKRKA